VGDLVIRVHTDEFEWCPDTIPLGTKTYIIDVYPHSVFVEKNLETFPVRAFGGNTGKSNNLWYCHQAFRLYEPPKLEQSTKSVSKPVDAVSS
jgi:hypothetical protein